MGKTIEVEATELKNGDIQKISLVTNGAIRQGFKILKTEEIPQDEPTMGKKIAKFFGQDNDEAAQVAALFVRKSVAPQWVPLIKSHGFRAEKEHAELNGDVLVLKQEGYDEEATGSVVAITPDVAVQFDRVVKYFDPYPESASFDENIKAAGFYPGLSNALSTLADTVWNVLNDADNTEEASAAIAKQVKAFGVHVNALVTELPNAVFKMEAESLQSEFAGSTVSNSGTQTIVEKDEETDMTKLTEAAAGDLDGLLDTVEKDDAAMAAADAAAEEAVEKDDVEKGDEGAPKTGGSPGSPVVEDSMQTDTGAVSLNEGGVPPGNHGPGTPDGFRKEERTIKSFEDGEMVEKTAVYFVHEENGEEIFGGFIEKAAEEEAPTADATSEADGVQYTAAELKLFESMNVLVKSVTEIKETVEKQAERIDAVEKTADEAKETAEDTVVMGVAADLDESLATLNGKKPVIKGEENVEKSDDDIFAGLLPQIEGAA